MADTSELLPSTDADLITPEMVKKAADAGERVGWETVLTPNAQIYHRTVDLQKYEAALNAALPDLLTRLKSRLQAEAQAPAVTRERHFVIHSLAAKYGIERMALGNLLNEWHAAFPTTTAPAPVDALTEDERELVSRARALAPTIMQYGHRDDAANTVARAFIAIDRLAPTQESKP